MNIFDRSSRAILSKGKSENGFRSFFFHNLVNLAAIILLFIFNPGCEKKEVQKKEESMPKRWETLLPVEIYYSSPAMSTDEKTVYIGTSTWLTRDHRTGQVFVAMDALTGKERWRLDLGSNEVRSSPQLLPTIQSILQLKSVTRPIILFWEMSFGIFLLKVVLYGSIILILGD